MAHAPTNRHSIDLSHCFLPLQEMQGQGTDVGGREELVDGVGGVCFVPSVMERWRELQEFQARPDDTLIATFPKAGECPLSTFSDCSSSVAGLLASLQLFLNLCCSSGRFLPA